MNRRIIFAAILAFFVYGMTAAMLGTAMTAFHLTMAQNGKVALSQALGLVIASLSAGPVIDNRGKKTTLVIGLGLIAAALSALPHAAGYKPIALCLFVLGLGGGVLVTAANSLAGDINVDRRASTLTFLNLFFGLGGLVTPFLAANLLNGDAMKLSYLCAALAGATLLVHLFTPMPAPTRAGAFHLVEAGMVLRRPALWLLAVFIFLYVGCEVGIWNWLATYLMSRGIGKTTALNILSLGFALGLLAGRIAAARILIRVSAPVVTLGASAAMAVTTSVLLQTSDPTAAWIAVFCAGLAMAPIFPTTLAMVADAFPVMTATAMGVVITFGWIGSAVSSPLIGAISGSDPARLGTALLILPAASLAMILVNLAVWPMMRRSGSTCL